MRDNKGAGDIAIRELQFDGRGEHVKKRLEGDGDAVISESRVRV